MLRGILSVIFGILLHTGWTALQAARPPQPQANTPTTAAVVPAAVTDQDPPPPTENFSVAGPFGLIMGGCGPVIAFDRTALLQAAADALGLTTDDLQAQLAAGQTLGQIADAQGTDRTAVTHALQAAATASLTAELNAAVAAGDLTQEQADARLADLAAQDFTAWLDRPFFPPIIEAFPFPGGDLPFGGDLPEIFGEGGVEVGLGGYGFHFSYRTDSGTYTFDFDDGTEAFRQAAASALGLSLDQLAARLDAGASLEDIAAAQNVPLADLRAALHTALVTAAQADVAAAVAAGRLTQAEADTILEQIEHMDDLPVFTAPGGLPGLVFPRPSTAPELQQEEEHTTY